MARYIDIEPVHKEIDRIQTSLESNDDKKWYKNKPYYKALAMARQIINEQPTADVVEVIRCKDCKRCELRYPAKAIGEEAIEGYYCRPNQRYVNSTDFCSYGTPKERSECDG